MSWVPFHHQDYSFKGAVDIFDYIRHRVVNFNEALDIKIISKKGKGKSTVALSMAMRLDPNFDVEKNIAFTAEEWLLKSAELKRGSVVLMEEIGTQRFASSHKWQSSDNQDFSDTVQLNRTDGQIYIATSVDEQRITNRVRDTFPVLIYPEKKITVRKKVTDSDGNVQVKSFLAVQCILRFAKEDIFYQNGGRDLLIYPRYAPGGVIKRVILYHPPKDVFDRYSEMRNALKEELKNNFLERKKTQRYLEEAGKKAQESGETDVNHRLRKRIVNKSGGGGV